MSLRDLLFGHRCEKNEKHLAKIRLLAGLGNPGKAYEQTRHNLGFLVVEEFARRYSCQWKTSSLYKARMAQAKIEDQDVVLFLPQTMMNLSGMAVGKIVRDRKISGENILVVCDDLNLEFGEMRVRKQGRDGGHNGLKSIIAQIGHEQFGRLRMGISRPPSGKDAAEYVLSDFSRSEQHRLNDFIREAADGCAAWISKGTDAVMNAYNKRKGNE